jgi:DNA-binding NarL/FixJ family response regulator
MALAPLTDLLAQAERLRRASVEAVGQDRMRRALTSAEAIVVAFVARGWPFQEIARVLLISVNTVSTHARHAAEKLVDGPGLEALATLRPALRVYEWARQVEGQQQQAS